MDFRVKTIAKLISTVAVIASTLGVASTQAQTSLQEHIDKHCKKDCVDAQKLVDASYRASQRFGIDYKALMAIVFVESKFSTKAKNGSSVGLTQVLLTYHRPKFMGRNVFDVDDNIFAGAQVFKECLQKHKGMYPKAFSCYNGYQHGDPKYKGKTLSAYMDLKKLDLPKPSSDPLGDFITHKAK